MRKKTILITGGLGFIGTNLVRRILETSSSDIIILDKATYAGRIENLPTSKRFKKRITVMKADVVNRRAVERAVRNSSHVVHMAAYTHTVKSLKNAVPTVFTNIVGTAVVLEAIRKYPVERFVLLSSSEVYGNKRENMRMDEEHPLDPVSPYAASKLGADRLASSFFRTKDSPVVILRLFNAYGPYQHPEKMIPHFITRLLRNMSITLNHGGKQTRDWVYVDDHVDAIEYVLNAPLEKVKGQVFNIGTGKATTVADIASLLLKNLGKDSSLLKIAGNSLPETMGNVGVSEKARKVLGWKAKTPLDMGIARTVDWYKRNKKWWEGFVR